MRILNKSASTVIIPTVPPGGREQFPGELTLVLKPGVTEVDPTAWDIARKHLIPGDDTFEVVAEDGKAR